MAYKRTKAFLCPNPEMNWSWFWRCSLLFTSFRSKPTKFTTSMITFSRLYFNFFWSIKLWYWCKFKERTPFYWILSLHRDMISAIGFLFNLAIEIAYKIASSSMTPSIIFFLATNLGTSYYPNELKIEGGNKSRSLSNFLRVCALLQFAAIRIISGLCYLM